MAYTINKFDGTLLATVADGTIDTSTTNIKLVGKNFTGYGEILDENFIHILENFSRATPPSTPLEGQLWWNSTIGTLSVWDGTQFKAVSSSTVSATEPTGAVEGDLWWKSDDEQLFVYNGATWVLVGPSAAAGAGQSGAIVEIITDTLAADHVIVSTYVADSRITITSGDATFTPNVALTGYGDIEPGVNLVSTGVLAGVRYQGTATNADLLDNLDSLSFLRSDESDSTSGILTVANDTGLFVGLLSDLQIGVTGTTVEIYNRTVGQNLIIGATAAGGGQISAFTIDPDAETISLTNSGGNSRITNMADPTADQDAATRNYVDVATNDAGGGSLFRDGSTSITGIGSGAGNGVNPQTDGTIDFGDVALRYRDIYAVTFNGLATEASYADLAERFEADTYIAPGTVVMLGGAKEIARVNEELSDDIFGVISEHPGFLMNAKAGTDKSHPPVAMSGRVPVRVVGEVRKGDRLVSAGNGVARAAEKSELTSFNVIGRSLEDKFTTAEGTVEAIVSMNS